MTETSAQALWALMAASPLARSPYAVAVRAADGSSAEVAEGRLGVDGDLTADTVMYAGSIAKQVIGVLAVQQVVDGRLDPDQRVTSYIDGLPDWAAEVRMRHLVHHTSALPDDPNRQPGDGNSAVLARLRVAPGLLARPGTTYRYSNVNYICLAEILSRVSRMRVEEMADRLFGAFGMTSCRLGGGPPPGFQDLERPPPTIGDGGLWVSARDLRRWNDAMNDQVLGSAVHSRAEAPGQLDDGTPLDYAWGVRVFDRSGQRTISHGGSWPTWSAKVVRQPDVGVSVAILTTNEDSDLVTETALALVDALAS